MLDAKSLELLNSLKSEIKSSKTVLKGRVKGTGKSFGFVVSEQDGQEVFLPPDEMKKVFPGDTVTFTVVESDNGKNKAELESLVNSELDHFTGVFYVRGKAQGVEPFKDSFNSWLFVPPKQTGQAKHNHIVTAKVIRHPWETGKAQATVLKTLGDANDNHTWYSMALAQYGIPEQFSKDEIQAANKIHDEGISIPEHYLDLTEIPFVTIDSASTKDMDDALYAEPDGDGWKLSVAIADASLFIKENSELDKAAQQRLTTTYLPGMTLPMLPENLSNDLLSLVPDQIRPVVVFQLSINADGSVTALDIQLGKIKSQGKLTYPDVAQQLESDNQPLNLIHLKNACQALAKDRQSKTAVVQNRLDYRIRVDEQLQATGIEVEPRNIARELVEEAMIATNRQVAKWLSHEQALFMAHAGFKPERESELKGLLRDYAPEVADKNPADLQQFVNILQTANSIASFPLTKVLQKRFDRGYWSAQAAPHFGLGYEQYTTATSPIRKYADLLIHRLIKSKLEKTGFSINNDIFNDFNERANQSRIAAQSIENRLRLNWLSKQPSQIWQGTVVHINANGLMVQLDDNGAVGFVDLKKQKDQYSYDPLRMLLKFSDYHYQIDQKLQIKVTAVTSEQLLLSIHND
jgi:VacB/RNase II family 3'-5' exoribonuclease